jgi:L-threonylcarbamoyladenylate synthase
MAASAAGSAESVGRLLDRAAEALRRGGLVVAPTETLVGLLADALHREAVRRLAVLKERPPDQPFPLLLPSVAALDRVAGGASPAARRLIAAFWPGPLTLLLPAVPGLPPEIVGPGELVAVRVPGPCLAADICRRTGGPLVATSANRRGAEPPAETADVDAAIAGEAELIVPGRAAGGLPSTIVACDDGGYRIVRPGAVEEAAIRGALR